MSRYVDVDKAKEKKVYSEDRHEYVVPVAGLDWLATEDVQEVRHGKWEKSLFAQDFFRCSLCSAVWNRKFEYCPHCGAKMDEEEKQQ